MQNPGFSARKICGARTIENIDDNDTASKAYGALSDIPPDTDRKGAKNLAVLTHGDQ